ncbi:MAG: AI-2E family transporter [Acidobacteria bacterium]|nr:MAG: AI-2E family transporter [Acidobacteriota bacterium]MCL4287257.1 AI-2E family transporter [Thermoleophilia bacterium]GIK77363.1 MAG: AI-2E family transporter [Actinomycetes bacterium]
MANDSRSLGGEDQPAGPDAAIVAVQQHEPTLRGIIRVVATVVASAVALYLVYLLRTPIAWLCIATFIAVAVAAPVGMLERRMPRGLAIALVYLILILIPIGIGLILVPPAVTAGSDLVNDLPGYVSDLNETVQENETLRGLNEDYDLVGKLEDVANDAAGSLDDVAATLADIGAGLIGSLFALFTIIVMSIFMVSRGHQWIRAILATRRPHEAEAIDGALGRMAIAVSSYVGGALAQAVIAAVVAFIVLTILGVPAPLALAVIIGILDLIPLVGATLGAFLVALVTLFNDFPTDTIVWVVFAIAYQQFENYVVQPRIQSRAVKLDPFVIVVAAIFGGTLLGIVGALLAIPVAAAGQIGVREFMLYRRAGSGRAGGDRAGGLSSEGAGGGRAEGPAAT